MTRSKTRTLLSALLLASSGLALGAAQAEAGDLIIAVPATIEPANLDYQVDPYTSTQLLNSFLTESLIVIAPDGTYAPALATDWDVNDTATQYTFTLRQDVVFTDGTPFNAAAVKANFDRIFAPETASTQMAGVAGPVKEIEVVDEFSVRFHYDAPWVTFLDAARRAPMWSPTAFAQHTPQTFDRVLTGTGPFKLESWTANDNIRMVRAETYNGDWNGVAEVSGPVALDSVTFRFIGEPAVLGAIVASGEAHIAFQIPALSVADYVGNEDYTLISAAQAGTGMTQVMNVRIPPLDNRNVRQALLYGRDMQMVNDLLYDGLYGKSDGPLNNIHPCFWEGASAMYPHDPAKAMALLEEAGWVDEGGGTRVARGVAGVEDGTPLTIRWQTLHHSEIGEALQAMYREIGIDMSVQVVPGPVQLEEVRQRTFNLMYERLRSMDPVILDDKWNPAYDQPGGWAWTGYDNPELTALVSQLRTNPDNAARCEIAKQAQQIIMEEALLIPTLSQPSFIVIDKDVEGFRMGAEGSFFFLQDVVLN
ncbi:MAG: ABC transporter substrate-binding protein [Rhodobacteraceae bacterium]|jgi:peptide/nickel transport system substrate-binding protein|nr:ABC transporter substrate-binding protein [Paracoccaceae bacterium]